MDPDKSSYDITNNPTSDIPSDRLTPRNENQVTQNNNVPYNFSNQMVFNYDRPNSSDMSARNVVPSPLPIFQSHNVADQPSYDSPNTMTSRVINQSISGHMTNNTSQAAFNPNIYSGNMGAPQNMADPNKMQPANSPHMYTQHMMNQTANQSTVSPGNMGSTQGMPNMPQQLLNIAHNQGQHGNMYLQNMAQSQILSPQMLQMSNMNNMGNFSTQSPMQHQQSYVNNQQQNMQDQSMYGNMRGNLQAPINVSSPNQTMDATSRPMPYLMQIPGTSSNVIYTSKSDMPSDQMSSSNMMGSQMQSRPNLPQAGMQQNSAMPQQLVQAPNAMANDIGGLQNRMNLVATQINQIQNNIASVTSSNQPNNAQLLTFLNQRLYQLKNIYCQMMLQLQTFQQQRNMMPMQTNFQQMMGNPMVNQTPAFSYVPQQVNLQPGQQHMNPNAMGRPSLMQNQMGMRMTQNMPNSNSLMPPGLARFQGPRPMVSGMNTGFGQPRTSLSYDANQGRRGGRSGRKRKHYSSESEEEEEITSSDADSNSVLTPSGFQTEDVEVRRSSRIQNSKSFIPLDFPVDDSESDGGSKKVGTDSPSTYFAQDLVPLHVAEQPDGKIMLIERILGDRLKTPEETPEPAEESVIIPQDSEEFYVKFKYYSYIHCEWCDAEELKRRDRNALSKIKRYKQKKRESPFLYVDDEMFNLDYIEIDRLLDVKQTTDPNNPDQMVTCYLVKWCSLPYDESTWEFADIIEKVYIDEFNARNEIPSPDMLTYKSKPHPFQFQKLSQSPVYKNNNMLREYQLEGINWLLYEYCLGTNCILADEMGLGKTIQSIAYLVEVRKLGIRGPFLVVAPLSTIGNWYREFVNWSDLNCVVLHGAASSRNIIHRYELYFRNENSEVITDACKFEVLITTYEMILSENKFLTSIRWRIAIIDEAHRLKNRKCKLLSHLSNLTIEHRVLLTGTPLQNTLDELLSLLHFLDPNRAQSLEQLMQQGSGKLETNQQVQQIQTFLKPVILRRLKEDVEKNIAPKEETIIEVEMTNIQKKVYRGVLERNLSFLTKGTSSTNLPNLMNIMMELRKCCNHPFLINGVEEKIINEYIGAQPDMDRGTAFNKALIESSGKMVLVDKLLPKLKENGHRMLIFSQMVRVLDLIEDYLVSHGFLFERIDGRVRGNDRQAAIDRFSKPDSDRTIFLLCTKAGGLGINLTAADTVIIFDSDWNPQNDIQAQARCHRIGQNKAVKVYRLICRKTYEREMFDRASLKLGLDKAVLQDINTTMDDKGQLTNHRAQLSKKEVEELLRKGAYAAVMDEDLDASAKFCSEDIEQILERRATVIQLAGETKGSTFAKASFNADIGGEQVDIDDPDFWQKWAKSANVNTKKDEFLDETPRIRKPIKPRGDDDDYEVQYQELIQEYENSSRRREPYPQRTSWIKKECLRVEKNLLTYGWGRWNEILINSSFKTNMTTNDVEQISKCILVIVWHVNKSDNSFNDFVEKALRMTTMKTRQAERDSEDYNYQPYGKRTRSKKTKHKSRKNDKGGSKICLVQLPNIDWKNTDIDTLVFDDNYKKHLQHCATKILIRLRLLFYIEHYILRDCKDDINLGVHVDDISLPIIPTTRNSSSFPSWWDDVCDRSLIIGTYRYGYEKYQLMKTDKQLCFFKHIPESKLSQENLNDSVKKRGRKRKVVTPIQSDDDATLELQLVDDLDKTDETAQSSNTTHTNVDLPSAGDLNTYIKRLVMTYWKNRVKGVAANKSDVRRSESRSKWLKREEFDFYKVVTRFSILVINNAYVWDNFRRYGHFERKDNNMLTEYYESLIQRSLALTMRYNELSDPVVPPVSDGNLNIRMAMKITQRVKLFGLVRECLNHIDMNHLDINLLLVSLPKALPSEMFPDWWSTQADGDLLKGTFMYGIKNDDLKLFMDSNFMFKSKLNEIIHGNSLTSSTQVDPTKVSLQDIKMLLKWPAPKNIVSRLFTICNYLQTLAHSSTSSSTLDQPDTKPIQDKLKGSSCLTQSDSVEEATACQTTQQE